MRRAVLGIDAGGQSFKVAPIDVDTCGLLCDPDYIRIDSCAQSEILLESFAEIIRRGISMSGNAGYEVEAVSFSCPGPMDYFKGISRMDHKWKSIKGISIPDYLHDKVLPPEIPVYFVHDAHSLIFGSVLNDDIKEKNIAGFIIGTGLGFGIVQNGNPVTDEYGVPVFGLFRRPYKEHHLEDYVASKGIPRLYEMATGSGTDLDAKAIGDLADAGDENAIAAYQKMGRILAENCSDLLAEYKIDLCVFGGRISNSFRVFGPSFDSVLHSQNISIETRHIENPEAVSMQGAANYALHMMRKGGEK